MYLDIVGFLALLRGDPRIDCRVSLAAATNFGEKYHHGTTRKCRHSSPRHVALKATAAPADRRASAPGRAIAAGFPARIAEKASMLRAAALVARAEALALDPNANVADVVKLNNLASRTLRVLGIRIEAAPKKAAPAGLRFARERWAAEEAKKAKTGEAIAANTEPPDGRAAE
jgi:hypothetical protein